MTMKTIMTTTGLAAVMAMVLSLGSTMAQTAAPQPDSEQAASAQQQEALVGLTPEQAKFFRFFDSNQDGRVSREEYRNVVVRFFGQMDRRHHGWVDDVEIRKAFPAVNAGKPIDPKLRMSLTEFEDFMLARFDKADDDHTGWLTPKQFVALQHIAG
jgi:hypothetical protein